MNNPPPKATHTGTLKIGDKEFACAVLEDGRRVLTQEGFLKAIGRAGKAKGGQGAMVDKMPAFLAAKNLEPFISKELTESTKPIVFRGVTGVRGFGYLAELLPTVCQVYLDARDANALSERQKPIATACDFLIRGLAHIGIIALVDEATGYQEIRDRQALQAILEAYLRKELAAWAKRFPEEFYQQIFRLRGWQWKGMKVNRPQVVAHWTNDLVYERLAPGILEELERRNPVDEKGQRAVKHHQWLTEDVGHPALAQHLHAVIGFMRASSTWDSFYRLMQRAFPKKGHTIEMPLGD
jgi:P63C domain-containing protein